VSWFYRCVIEQLFGLKGNRQGLAIEPQLPRHWTHVKVTRQFRGATFEMEMRRVAGVERTVVAVDGQMLNGNQITEIESGKRYHVDVKVPEGNE